MEEVKLIEKEQQKEQQYDLAKFRKAFESIKKEEIDPAIKAGYDFIEDIGKLFVVVGKLQKNNEKAYNLIMNISENPQLFMSVIINTLPPEKIKKIVQDFLEVTTALREVGNIRSLDGDLKIKIGKQMISIISDLKSIDKKKTARNI